ncbi:MAG: TM2 domain-containing protein [Dehalococcoidia bacterium]|nr:TM2 domain-containing protein [Dehalococcoidia bacterium]
MNCGARPMASTSFCSNCGNATTPASEICVKCGARLTTAPGTQVRGTGPAATVSSKSRTATTLLAFFLGSFGAHRFYAGKIGSAVAMLLLTIVGIILTATLIGAVIGVPILIATGIWELVDFIVTVTGNAKDSQGKRIAVW